MNTAPSNSNGTTEFLNFSDALNYLRWGERIARRSWVRKYVVADYSGQTAGLIVRYNGANIRTTLSGTDLMAEDWYVLGEHE